jgi:hypothetical protein
MEGPDVIAAVLEKHPELADDAPDRQTVDRITAKVLGQMGCKVVLVSEPP